MFALGTFSLWFGLAVVIGIWASNKGRHGFGWFLLACIISPLLAAAFLAVVRNKSQVQQLDTIPNEETHVRCVHCAEYVLPQATKCKHCGSDITPVHDFKQRQAESNQSKKDEDAKNLLIGIAFVIGLIAIAKFFS
jgi:hypothetical protein